MNKRVSLVIFLLLTSISFCSAQNSIYFSSDSIQVKWKDNFGEVIKKERVSLKWRLIHNDRIQFELNGKIGLADTAGNVIAEPIYDEFYVNSIGLPFMYQIDSLIGYIDSQTGNPITAPDFHGGHHFSEGLAAVTSDGKKWGYIDLLGQLVIEPQWSYAGPFGDGMARVFNSDDSRLEAIIFPADIYPTPGKCGYIDKHGTYIIPMEYSYIGLNFPDERFMRFTRGEYHCDEPNGYCINPYEGSKWGIMDITGRIVLTDNEYDFIERLQTEKGLYFIVQKEGKVGLLDPNTIELTLPLGNFSSFEEFRSKLHDMGLSE